MKYTITTTNRFDKQYKKCLKRGFDKAKFHEVVNQLVNTGTVAPKYKPHKLSGRYHKAWECHIEPDWLLIWEQNDLELTLLFLETGTHADLF